MKPRGRSPKLFTQEELLAITEYLTTDKSYKEVALKYGMPESSLQYKVRKYRKEQEVSGKKEVN